MTKHTDEVCISDNTRALNQGDDSHLVLCELPPDARVFFGLKSRGRYFCNADTPRLEAALSNGT